jgi:hypothetical protein
LLAVPSSVTNDWTDDLTMLRYDREVFVSGHSQPTGMPAQQPTRPSTRAPTRTPTQTPTRMPARAPAQAPSPWTKGPAAPMIIAKAARYGSKLV